MTPLNNATRLVLILAALVSFTACDRGPSPEVQARIDALQTARDSLSQELADQNQYVQNLTAQIEDALGNVEGTRVVSPEAMESRLSTLRQEMETARSQLADARQRANALNRQARTLRDSLNTVITERDEALAIQRDSIGTLVTSLDSMTSTLDGIRSERMALEEQLNALQDRYYTVFYVVGTKEELIERGIVEEEGGARVLLVLWKAGETLVPARDLDPERFQAVDFRQTSTLELPGPGTYTMVSRHDTALVEPTPNEDGRFVGGELRITEPEAFWQASRYLILVAEE